MQIRVNNAAIRHELQELEGHQRMFLLLLQVLQQVCNGSSAPAADGATKHADAAPIL
jgi:hypothetical protein